MKAVLLLLLATAAWPQQPRPAAVPEPGGVNLPAQKIGPNDLIAISVYGAPEFTRTVRVGDDGLLRLPMLKRRFQADGLLPAALESSIAEALVAENVLVDPVVTVTVVEYHSRPISVAGAVRSPLTFQAIGTVTLLEAVTRAGGLAPNAGPEILVTRSQPGPDGAPTPLTCRVSVRALFDSADPGANLKLYGGEEIRVPDAPKVFVVGNVKKPGAFPVQDSTETSVLRALALSEGLAPYAAKDAFILRRDDRTGAHRELPIELRKILERKSPDVPLLPNDVLYIPDNSSRRSRLAALEKAVILGSAATSALIYGLLLR